jgi:hypothetical protein
MGAEFLPQKPWGRNTMGKKPWEKFMVFHGCRNPTSKAMGSKYHGEKWEKFMVFHGCRNPTSKAMGFFHGFPMGNFYKGSVTLSCSACIKLENVFGNLFAVLFIHVTCDAHLSSQCWNHARKYSAMHLRRIFNRKKLTVSRIFICMFTVFKLWQWYIVVKLMLHS